MQELIEKLRSATEPSNELSALATVAIFGGKASPLGKDRQFWRWQEEPNSGWSVPLHLTVSVDDINAAFDRALPGHGRIIAKGRITETEPLYGCQIFSTDLSPAPLEPIGEGEHNLEAYAYLIAILQAVEAKRSAAA